MHDDFSSWYAGMSFQPDAAFTEKRWAAVDEHVQAVSKDSLALLSKLAFRLNPQMGSSEVAALRQALTGEATSPGDEELLMLSAAALAAAVDSDADGIAALAATVVMCVACASLRALEQPMDLVGKAANVLRQLSETSRRRPSLKQAKFIAPTVDKNDEGYAQALATANVLTIADALVTATNKSISALAKRQRDFEMSVQKYVNIQDEELDILWWIEGKHSFDLDQGFSQVSGEHLPLAIARELAGLTKVLPGPPALHSLLSRTGLLAAPEVSVVDAIQSMPPAWLSKVVEPLKNAGISPTLTPILFGLQRRQEVHGKDDWIAPWCTTTGLSRDVKLAPISLAEAAYREFSLTMLG